MRCTICAAAVLICMAAQAEEPALDRARALAAEAQTAYDLGHYDAALKRYEELYQIKAVAGVLFNVAQCHRKLGQLKEAADLYRSFLVHADPQSGEAAKAQELLVQVESALKEQEAAARAAPQGTAPLSPKETQPAPAAAVQWMAPPVVYLPQPAPPPSHKAAYVLGGTAVAALVAGVVFGLSSKSAANSLSSGIHSHADANDLADKHEKDAYLADILFGGAGALGLATVIAW